MKKDKESSLPEDWHNKGSLDIRRSEILLKNDDPEGAAFHLQQALEKYLKGYLVPFSDLFEFDRGRDWVKNIPGQTIRKETCINMFYQSHNNF